MTRRCWAWWSSRAIHLTAIVLEVLALLLWVVADLVALAATYVVVAMALNVALGSSPRRAKLPG